MKEKKEINSDDMIKAAKEITSADIIRVTKEMNPKDVTKFLMLPDLELLDRTREILEAKRKGHKILEGRQN